MKSINMYYNTSHPLYIYIDMTLNITYIWDKNAQILVIDTLIIILYCTVCNLFLYPLFFSYIMAISKIQY